MTFARDKANQIQSAFRSVGVDDNADTLAITIDSSEKVGIGTASPASELQVDGASTPKITVRSADGTSASVKLQRINENDVQTDFELKNDGGAFKIKADNASQNEFDLFKTTPDETIIYTGNTERMRVNSSGNVGIGESSPLGKLHVKTGDSGGTPQTTADELVIEGSGDMGIQLLGGSSSDCGICFGDAADPNVGLITYNHTSNYLRFKVNAAEVLRIDSSGLVRVGNTSHTNSLIGSNFDLVIGNESSGASGLAIISPNNENSYLGFFDTDNSGSFRGALQYNHTNDFLRFYVSGSEAVRIDSSGKVGIGLTSPTAKLSVGGHMSITATSRLYLDGAGDTFISEVAANAIAFTTGNSERVRINSSGNVGVGTSSPTAKLQVDGNFSLGNLSTGTANSSYRQIQLNNGVLADSGGTNSAFQILQNAYVGTGNNNFVVTGSGSSHASRLMMTSGVLSYATQNGLTANNQITWSEKFRVDSSGNFFVAKTSSGYGDVGHEFLAGGLAAHSRNQNPTLLLNRNTSEGTIQLFRYNNSDVGSISVTSSSTAFNTSSDYRLKENVSYDFDATSRLKQLKPSRFNFIADADKTVDGFLAHEVSSIVPEAITGEKDAVDSDGNPEYQGIDQSKLVPLLVKTIQELEARITTLENN